MYIFENQNYTEEDLGKIADIKGYTFDELLEKNPSIKKTDPDPEDEGKTPPSQETMDATVEVSDTASNLENGSSELQKTSVRNKTRQKDLNINKVQCYAESIKLDP